ncbi:MAG: exo-alpha-sialidase [Paenibacillaceae bacterium]|nr:exo-alpha-sialidase [Paenibacillaceae bacterium]
MKEPMPALWRRDPRLVVISGEETIVAEGGLQPFLAQGGPGTLVMQCQLPAPSYPSQRMVSHHLHGTFVSRDGGERWERQLYRPGENEAHMEGGSLLLQDGTAIVLDTYVTPAQGGAAGCGAGQMWETRDDWRTLQGPYEVDFALPGIDFHASKDDGGRPHEAVRLHRSVVELPNGDWLATLYGWMQGDDTPSAYIASMKKTRCMLVRSTDRGRQWTYLSTIAVDPAVGTEGFDEPVLARLSMGPLRGRLICHVRTGRELYEAVSDDDGETWSAPAPVDWGGVIDIRRTDLWAGQFAGMKTFRFRHIDHEYPLLPEGAVVDPDLLELRSGLLVSAFGVRIPEKGCWEKPEHPWNGSFLAFSFDQGASWSHIVQMTSGELTTHYIAVAETEPDTLVVLYDRGDWSGVQGRHICGRKLRLDYAGPLFAGGGTGDGDIR